MDRADADPGNGGGDGDGRAVRSTRRRVLQAAYGLFDRDGIAATPLSAIAAAAGVDDATVIAEFGDKDELVLALLEEQVMHRLAAAADQFVQAQTRDEGLVEVGQLLVQAMHIDAPVHRFIAENYAITYHDPPRREALAARRREAHAAVTRVLVRLEHHTGLTLAMPPEQTAVAILALSNGLGIEAGLNPDAVPTWMLGQLLGLMVTDR